ncbi:MAG: pre-peptidase [Limisphaerales bacterium]|nr:MAG: pre-peptidase [Limisphaerales bacterium]TXT46414.1 MAG: pre-peptidase [Limisphaerales bacterium]
MNTSPQEAKAPSPLRSAGAVQIALVLSLALGVARAQDKKAEDKSPKVIVPVPLGIVVGKTNTVEIRGLNLDAAKALHFTDAAVTARVASKGKAEVPQNQKKERFGDTQVKAEVFVPADFKGDEAAFTVETPDGKSAPAKLAVLCPGAFVEESEDNGSFAKPQSITLPTSVRGSIKAAQDVDVFAFEGKAGQRVTAEILAARLGSPLDATLTLWNASNTLLASADDSPGDRDPRLAFTLPAAGRYFLVVLDAHDQGSVAHGYLLSMR